MSWFEGEKIVVPFDYSDESIEAVRVALQLAKAPDHVLVVNVLLPASTLDPAVVWNEKHDETRAATAKKTMLERLEDAGADGPQLVVLVGDPGASVADFADEIDAGMVVVSSHGKSGFKRMLLGSVAERVVRLVHCPVLVLKPPRKKSGS